MNSHIAIRLIRSIKGLSQKELAVKTLLDPSYISLLEKGKRSPSMKTFEKIAEALDVPVHLMILLSSDQLQLREISESDASYLGRHIIKLLSEINV
jgi:transcriptional regulator with XRE-family HTH domain